MARRRSNWTENLHPRDFRGRFRRKAGAGKPSKKGRPGWARRQARGANTVAQVLAGSAVGSVVPIVGSAVGGYIALNRRRNAQVARGEIGLRSTWTGRRLT